MPKGVFRYSKPDRDRRILEQLQVGRQNSQIARSLGLSAATVRMYISEIFEDLGTHNRAEAVYVAMERGLLKAPARR